MKTNSFTLENPMTPPVNLLEDKDVEMQDVANTVRQILYINSFTLEKLLNNFQSLEKEDSPKVMTGYVP